MATYVLVHGATAGGWYWHKVVGRLRAAGQEVYAPTLTGLGERVHLATPQVGLDTHIDDVTNVLVYEDLRGVILVGKSYAGMVVTGVAERAPERVGHLVYVDAVVPQDGQSLVDVCRAAAGPEATDAWLARARAGGDGWRLPLRDPPDPRLTPQPLRPFTQPVAVGDARAAALPRTYIYCTVKARSGVGAAFTAQGAAQARAAGWRYRELPTGHNPEQTLPQELTDLLLELA